jgi:hypothetical protein
MTQLANNIVPVTKPKLTQEALRALISAENIDRALHPIVVVGVRDYYLSVAKANDAKDGKVDGVTRDMYDDAIFFDTPNMTMAFNGNTDPTRYRIGQGTGATKGMASLNPGIWNAHQFGIHNGEYPALVQTGGKVQVTRDGTPPYQDQGYFGINIHKGGWGITSSEGCQTIYPSQWPDFINNITAEAIKAFGATTYKTKVIPYLLILNTGQISQ